MTIVQHSRSEETPRTNETLDQEVQAVIALLDAGIAASKEGGFTILKVDDPVLGWVSVGEFLSGRYFHDKVTDPEMQKKIIAEYTNQAIEYDEPKPAEVVPEAPKDNHTIGPVATRQAVEDKPYYGVDHGRLAGGDYDRD